VSHSHPILAESRPANSSRSSLGLLAGWTATGVALYGVAPMTAPVVLPLAVVAPLAWCRARGAPIAWRQPSPAIVALLLAGGYLLLNASWSQSPAFAYSFVAEFFVFIAVLHVTSKALQAMEEPALRALAMGLCVGMFACSVVLCFEAVSHQWVTRKLMTHIHLLRPNARDMRVEAGQVVYLEPFLLNRGMTALALLFWPTMLAISRLDLPPPRRAAAFALVLAPALGAIAFSQHATSKIALAGSIAIFVIALLSTRAARRTAILGWTAATLLVVPVAALAYGQHLYMADWLAYSAKHRIIIWGYTAEQAIKAPLLGAGIGTTRAIHNTSDRDAPFAPGTQIQITIGWHSHNGYLQTWYEAGAVGAVFLLGIGLLLLQSTARAPPIVQPQLYATFTAGALLAASSFSIWAPWFMASLYLAGLFAILGLQLTLSQETPEDRNLVAEHGSAGG
jgi:O-antigen ligase